MPKRMVASSYVGLVSAEARDHRSECVRFQLWTVRDLSLVAQVKQTDNEYQEIIVRGTAALRLKTGRKLLVAASERIAS